MTEEPKSLDGRRRRLLAILNGRLSRVCLTQLAYILVDVVTIRSVDNDPPTAMGEPILVFLTDGTDGVWEIGTVEARGRLHGPWIAGGHLKGFRPTHWARVPPSPVPGVSVI